MGLRNQKKKNTFAGGIEESKNMSKSNLEVSKNCSLWSILRDEKTFKKNSTIQNNHINIK